jgi:hypothetical protein
MNRNGKEASRQSSTRDDVTEEGTVFDRLFLMLFKITFSIICPK